MKSPQQLCFTNGKGYFDAENLERVYHLVSGN